LLYLSVENSGEPLEPFVNNLGFGGPVFARNFEAKMAKVHISCGF
jgi:hypothetical protein